LFLLGLGRPPIFQRHAAFRLPTSLLSRRTTSAAAINGAYKLGELTDKWDISTNHSGEKSIKHGALTNEVWDFTNSSGVFGYGFRLCHI
jgi:hypothetical protein